MAAVKTASKFRFFDCENPVSELGLELTPIEESFKKSIDWFRENDYIDRTRQKN